MPAAKSDRRDASCPHCGGGGWVVDEGRRARRCDCHFVSAQQQRVLKADVPERYRHCRFATFKLSHDTRDGERQLSAAVEICRRYVEDFLVGGTDRAFCDRGLIFIGPPGAGKTHLAVAVLNELVELYGVRGRFVELTSMLQELQVAMDPSSGATRTAVLRPVEQAEVLVIDELGAQRLTPWTRDVLYYVLNRRYAGRLPTLFTTNYRLDDRSEESLDRGPDRDAHGRLSYRLPAMLVSRLWEMATPVMLDAVGDYRRDVRAHQNVV